MILVATHGQRRRRACIEGPAETIGPRWRVWIHRLALVALVLTLLVSGSLAVAWMLTPGVGDVRARIRAELRSTGTSDPVLANPPRVASALIATEDSRFYSNPGVDLLSLPRAAVGAIDSGSEQGGATLEQQLAKMVYPPTVNTNSAVAQTEQAVLALKLDTDYSKAQILQMYLAVVYFGHGYYGLNAASTGYFNRPPDTLSWAQASLLAGLVQAPTAYDPLQHYALARQRERHVLDRLAATGKLTMTQANAAFAAPLAAGLNRCSVAWT